MVTNIPAHYNSYWNFVQPPLEKTGGIAVFSKSEPISIKQGLGLEKHDKTGNLLTLEFNKFFLVNVAVPFSGLKGTNFEYRINEWDPDFHWFLGEL